MEETCRSGRNEDYGRVEGIGRVGMGQNSKKRRCDEGGFQVVLFHTKRAATLAIMRESQLRVQSTIHHALVFKRPARRNEKRGEGGGGACFVYQSASFSAMESLLTRNPHQTLVLSVYFFYI